MILEPIFFERNRVGRVYTGGKLFSGFFGDEAKDGFLPEEWIASNVKAINKVMAHEKEGVSKIKGSNMFFDELLEKNPEEMLGSAKKLRILVKILDSAVRLPAQAHPDKKFSKEHFNSEYGKTESWIVLDTRENAKIYFGFKDGVTKSDFEEAVNLSETDKKAMERLMKYVEPKKGDVFLVPAKTVHAIGAGCLILEIQEPTDFTIQPERWCDEYKLSDDEMYIGLKREDALSCFDFGENKKPRIYPKIISEKEGVLFENLIGEKDTDCFIVNCIMLSGGKHLIDVKDSYGIYIVTEGNGILSNGEYINNVKKGDYFFMPASLMGKFCIEGNLTMVECY